MASYTVRFIFLAGSIICLSLFWLAGGIFGVPYYRGQEASLLAMPSPVSALVVAAVVFYLCTALGTLLAGRVYDDAGLFLAAVGLSALSMRGGPMGVVLRGAAGPGVFLTMAWELAILYAIVTVAWLVLTRWARARETASTSKATVAQCLQAMGLQAAVTTIVMLLLAQSDAKAQVLLSVGIAAWAGGAAACWLFPTVPSVWLWTGPLIVGLVGYIGSYFLPDGWTTGHLTWAWAALARPLPLDYASFGPAGAMLGCWMARGWRAESETVSPTA